MEKQQRNSCTRNRLMHVPVPRLLLIAVLAGTPYYQYFHKNSLNSKIKRPYKDLKKKKIVKSHQIKLCFSIRPATINAGPWWHPSFCIYLVSQTGLIRFHLSGPIADDGGDIKHRGRDKWDTSSITVLSSVLSATQKFICLSLPPKRSSSSICKKHQNIASLKLLLIFNLLKDRLPENIYICEWKMIWKTLARARLTNTI